jgi:hypothetical protein
MIHMLQGAIGEGGGEGLVGEGERMGGPDVDLPVDAGSPGGFGHAGVDIHAHDVPHMRPDEAEEPAVPAADVQDRLGERKALVGGIFPGSPKAQGRDVRIQSADDVIGRQDGFDRQAINPHSAFPPRPWPSARLGYQSWSFS